MSDYVDSGILFKNQDKREQKHPDYKGDLTMLCEHCGTQSRRRLAAWIRESRTGSKFLSLSFKPRQESAVEQHGPQDSF